MNQATSYPVIIRPAYPDDAPALWRLAALDSAALPAEPLILAEVDGELRAAVSMADLDAIADPFVRTASLVQILRDYVARSAEDGRPRHEPRGVSLRPAAA